MSRGGPTWLWDESNDSHYWDRGHIIADDKALYFGDDLDATGQFVSASNYVQWTGVDWYFNSVFLGVDIAPDAGAHINLPAAAGWITSNAASASAVSVVLSETAGLIYLHFGATTRFTFRATDLELANNVGMILSGTGGFIELNTAPLRLDGDDDTYLHAPVDDVAELVLATASGEFQININGADDFTFTANSLNVLTGSSIVMADGTTISTAAGPVLTFDDTGNHLELTGASLLINETVNTDMTIGLTINQAANTDEITAFKNSNVAHGMTDITETDTFGYVKIAQGTSGGLGLWGYKDADGVAGRALLLLGALGEAADTTKSTAAQGVVQISAQVKSGTNITDVGADGNLAIIRNNATTRFIFDAEGTGHADDSWTTFSDRRQKQSIQAIGYGLNTVLDLKPVSYRRRDNNKSRVGLIAQDVRDVVPEAVRGQEKFDSFLSLDYNSIVPVLVRAVQELSAKVKELQDVTQ